jgi:SAM-dependent methyltransferase
MPWFRKPAGEPLAVAMSGVKLGDRLLVIGASDIALVAALASKVGLTGRACLVADSEGDRSRAAAAVEREGALIESFAAPSSALPFEAGAFDVAVIRSVLPRLAGEARRSTASEVERVLRPGGRCNVIDDAKSGGLAGLLRRAPAGDPTYAADGAAPILTASGFRGVRVLAEREGLVFVEGVKPGN